MRKLFYAACACAMTILCSCGGRQRPTVQHDATEEAAYEELVELADHDCDDNDRNSSADRQQVAEDLVMCPMCGGSLIAVLDPSNPIGTSVPCPGCDQKGRVTREKAQEINYSFDQIEAVMGPGSVVRYYDNGIMSGGSMNSGGSGNRAQIEYELNKAINHLHDLERNMNNNANNASLKAQYSRLISDQQALIARLQQQLANCR